MIRTILISTLTFLLGAATTLVLVNPKSVNGVISKITNNSQSLDGTVWLCEENSLELVFTEGSNKCYFTDLNNGASVVMTYSQIKNKLMIEPQEDLSALFLMARFEGFNIKAEITSNGIIEMVKKGGVATFKRQKDEE